MATRTRTIAASLSSIASALLSSSVLAYEPGDVIARAGTHYVDPQNDNGTTVKVGAAWGLTASAVYFIQPTLAVDLLVAVPYKHDLQLKSGGADVASTRELPPTLSLAWYPAISRTWQPFLGGGVNYTVFFDEQTKGALAGAKLHIDHSFGLAAQAGLQVNLTPQWGVMLDVRYLSIEPRASVNGSSISKVPIDPMGYGAALTYRF